MTAIVPGSDQQSHPDSDIGLEPPQLLAIGLIVAGEPYNVVADKVDRDRRTLNRWRHQPAFAKELRRQLSMRTSILQQEAHARMLGLVDRALDVVDRSLNDPGPYALAAARIVLARFAQPAAPSTDSPAPSADRLAVDAMSDEDLRAVLDAARSREQCRRLSNTQLTARARAATDRLR